MGFFRVLSLFLLTAQPSGYLLANINKVKGVLRAERLDKGVV
jgi:hypothetical protein